MVERLTVTLGLILLISFGLVVQAAGEDGGELVKLAGEEWVSAYEWIGDFEYERRWTTAQRQKCVAYSNTMKAAHVRSLHDRNLPWLSPTPSANDDLIIAHSRGRLEDPAIPPQPIFGYKITDPDSEREKVRVVVAGSNHAREHPACWALHAMVEFLVSNDPRAREIRLGAKIFVYPVVNPDGKMYLESEEFRDLMTVNGNPELSAAGENNHNRVWDRDGAFSSIDAVKAAMINDAGPGPDYLLDFHGIPQVTFAFACEEAGSSPLAQTMMARGINLRRGGGHPGMLRSWAMSDDGLAADYAFTPEVANGAKETLFSTGKQFALTLHDVVAGDVPDVSGLPPNDGESPVKPGPPAVAWLFDEEMERAARGNANGKWHRAELSIDTRFDGPGNRSLHLADEESYVDFDIPAALDDRAGALTVAGWVKGDTESSDTTYLISRYSPGNDERSWALAQLGGTREMIVTLSADGTHDRSRIKRSLSVLWPRTEVFDGTWRHVAFTFEGDGEGEVRLFVDGVELRPGWGGHRFDDSPVAALHPAEAPVAIGSLPGSQRAFRGLIDEMAIWNVALSPSEIRWLSKYSIRTID